MPPKTIAIIDLKSKKTASIAEVLNRLRVEYEVLIAAYWAPGYHPDYELYSGIILSGSNTLLTETNMQPYLKDFAFLKDLQIPVLGICFGHQLLGVLHGADVFKGEPVRKSIQIKIIQKDNLFEGLENQPTFVEDHTEGITLPLGFDVIAQSDQYEVEAMRHKQKPMYGVQFHPEVSGKNGEIILKNFCDLINPS